MTLSTTPLPTIAPSLTITPSPTITQTRTPVTLPPLEITFDGVYSLSLDFRQAVRDVLDANQSLLPDSRLTVSAYRNITGWAKITLVPTSFVETAWANVESISPVEIIARQTHDQWVGYLVGSPDFETIMGDIPRSFIDYISPLPSLEGEYLFPWQNGQNWWAIQGWHDGNALDFQPGIGARYAVLAAQSGRMREICSDGYQSLIEIQHADERQTYYLHITLSLSVRRQLLDHAVRRGQYLGELIGQSYFRTPCGQGSSRHLHFAVSDRAMIIERFPLEGIAASASCCANPPVYRSTNLRVDLAS